MGNNLQKMYILVALLLGVGVTGVWAQMLPGYAVTSASDGQTNVIEIKDFRGVAAAYANVANRDRNNTVPTIRSYTFGTSFPSLALQGVYTLINRENGAIYVGSRDNATTDIYRIDPITLNASFLLSATDSYVTFTHDTLHNQLLVLLVDGTIERWSENGGSAPLQSVASAAAGTVTAMAFNQAENAIYVAHSTGLIQKMTLNANGSIPSPTVWTTVISTASYTPLSNPWDIEFNNAGTRMILGERGSGTLVPHSAQTVLFSKTGTTWARTPGIPAGPAQSTYGIGCVNVPTATPAEIVSGAGGVSFVPSFDANGNITSDDAFVAMMGNALHFSSAQATIAGCNYGTANDDNIYGVQILPLAGGSSSTAVLVDLNNNLTDVPKGRLYDVSIYSPICSSPTASVTPANSTICAGNTLSLRANALTGLTALNYTYSWIGPNGYTSSGFPSITRASATTSMSGVYTATITDRNNCRAVASTTFTVSNGPAAAAATVTNSGNVCLGASTTLTASGGTTYAWSGPNGFTSALAAPTLTNVTTPMGGVYTVTIGDATGCTVSRSVTVTALSLPVPNAGGNNVCLGGTLNLTSSGGGTYAWSGPNGFTSTLQNPTISNVQSSNYGVYRVTVTSAAGCVSSSSSNNAATISQTTGPAITVTNTSGILCAGGTLSLSATGAISYVWSGPSSFTSTLANPTRTPATIAMSGIYSVTATDAGGCISTGSASATVQALPTGSAGNGGAVCAGGTASLTASGGTTYAWSGPNSFTSTLQNPTIAAVTTAAAGIYTYQCCGLYYYKPNHIGC